MLIALARKTIKVNERNCKLDVLHTLSPSDFISFFLVPTPKVSSQHRKYMRLVRLIHHLYHIAMNSQGWLLPLSRQDDESWGPKSAACL